MSKNEKADLHGIGSKEKHLTATSNDISSTDYKRNGISNQRFFLPDRGKYFCNREPNGAHDISRLRDRIFRQLVRELRGDRLVTKGQFAQLVFDVPNVGRSKNFGVLDDEELFGLGLCIVPNPILNALVCGSLYMRFGDDLRYCNCFYKLNGFWRLDVDPYLAKRGFLMPIRSTYTKLVTHMLAFRDENDQKPFTLKLREGHHARNN